MKKLLAIAMIVIILSALFITPAFAHGARHSGRQASSYSVCNTENCTFTGLHRHSGTTYSAHYYGDGHDYHGYCDIEGCTKTGYHAHDGEYCFGHTRNDGHGYHRSGRGHH